MERGNWTDNPCFYVSVIDGPRYSLLAGPLKTHEDALALVDIARRHAQEVDPRAVFYAFGTCKRENGHRDGILNDRMFPFAMCGKAENCPEYGTSERMAGNE